jgi:hypothetical protein
MTRAIEHCLSGVDTRIDDAQRKFWSLSSRDIRLVTSRGLRDSKPVALEMSIRRADQEGAAHEVEALRRLQGQVASHLEMALHLYCSGDAVEVLEPETLKNAG